MKDIFTNIYKNKSWQDNYGTESGPGSSIECAKAYLDFLQEFCKSNNVTSILDLGCGDFNLMRHFDFTNINYFGVDIVDHVILQNQNLYQSKTLKFESESITDYNDENVYDLLICKDVLQHLSHESINKILSIKNYKQALYINDFNNTTFNQNVENGQYSPIDLSATPFNLKGEYVFEWLSCDCFTKKVFKVG